MNLRKVMPSSPCPECDTIKICEECNQVYGMKKCRCNNLEWV